ncbi:MAG: response regulator, partial [Bdellovibrionota bacterium]
MSKSLDSPVKILLADDSVTMHRAVSLALKKESYELICVDNGKDALRLVHEHRPQIVLLDLDMPEMTGIEVAQEIRSDATLKSVQIVLLCGSFDEVNEKDIEKAPVDARLWKPFESHVLLAMLRTLRGARTPSAQASATAPGIASEATAPQAPRPAALPRNLPPTPRAPLPKLKTRKEEVVESASLDLEDRSQTIPNDSTEQLSIRQSVEATMPLTRSVSDLFDPLKRPAIPDLVNMAEETDGGDFTRELARETFSDRPFPDELPSPSEAAERTAPLRGAAAAPQNAQPKEDPFVNNLWSSEEL